MTPGHKFLVSVSIVFALAVGAVPLISSRLSPEAAMLTAFLVVPFILGVLVKEGSWTNGANWAVYLPSACLMLLVYSVLAALNISQLPPLLDVAIAAGVTLLAQNLNSNEGVQGAIYLVVLIATGLIAVDVQTPLLPAVIVALGYVVALAVNSLTANNQTSSTATAGRTARPV